MDRLTADEKDILDQYRRLDDHGRVVFRASLEALLQRDHDTKKKDFTIRKGAKT